MTRSFVTRRTSCRLCDSRRVELAVPFEPSPIADAYVPAERVSEAQPSYPLDLYLCRSCGHVQLLDVVDPGALFGDYIYSTSISLGLVEHFRRYADELLQRFPVSSPALAVDIGSNDGTFLRFLRDRGLRVLGVDPAVGIAAQATRDGVETVPAFFTSSFARRIREERGPAAFVTANNVFAHSDGLPDMADGVRELLRPDGVFVFEVSYLVDIVEKLLFDTVYHEHLCYHSIKSLSSFFSRHDLELFDVTRLPGKGGSIRGFVQRSGAGRPREPVIDDLLALESRMGLDQPAVFKEFSGRLAAIKAELHGLLDPLRASGKALAGYGASATVTTMIHNFELGPFLSYLADDNPARHGLFSPGLHLPVLPSQALYERKPDFVIVLAWQYAEPIMKKNQGYLEQGGHFVLPLPRVQVL